MSKNVVRSMTAFSRSETSHDWGSLSWEIRSVNHRYLDSTIRLPEALRSLEAIVREQLRKQLSRGKVDCTLQWRLQVKPSENLQLNQQIIDQYLAAVHSINQRLIDQNIPVSAVNSVDLLFKPGIIEQSEMDNEKISEVALALFNQTLSEHIAHREREGAELSKLIQQRLKKISDYVLQLKPMIPAIVKLQKEKLHARLSELKGELNPERLEQEITLLAQRVDVDEELDRLNTHLIEVKRALNEGGGIGRRLDFLMQELNRETNTLSSKSISADSTLIAVDMKVLIEQMREQIQNIE